MRRAISIPEGSSGVITHQISEGNKEHNVHMYTLISYYSRDVAIKYKLSLFQFQLPADVSVNAVIGCFCYTKKREHNCEYDTNWCKLIQKEILYSTQQLTKGRKPYDGIMK